VGRWQQGEACEAHWFCVPDVAPFTNFWFGEILPAPHFGFDGDWRDSLVELQED